MLLAVTAGAALGAEPLASVQAIPHLNWQPPEALRPVRVIGAEASSAFGPDYRPELAADGNPSSKWVASEQPSPERPQWLVLRLAGPHDIDGLALFGEAPDNDGFIAGAVQVLLPGGTFATVLDIAEAPGRAWLARFPAVRTTAVRLLITRSGGPTTHTDIYEVMPFGEPLPPGELLPYLASRLDAAKAALGRTRDAAAAPEAAPVLRRIGMDTLLQGLGSRLEEADRLRGDWDRLGPAERSELAERAETLAAAAERLAESARETLGVWPPRLAAVDALRGTAAAAGERPARPRLEGAAVALELDEDAGTWSAIWAHPGDAAVCGAAFLIEVDGRRLTPAGVTARLAPPRGEPGAGGVELVQTWGEGVLVERRLRLHRDGAAILLSGSVTNATGADIAIGKVCLVDVGPDGGGWWHAGQVFQSPGVVTVAGDSLFVCEPVGEAAGPAADRSYGGTMLLGFGHQDPASAFLAGFVTGLEARPRAVARFRAGAAGAALSLAQDFHGRRLPPGQRLDLDTVELRAGPDPWETLARFGDDIAAMARGPVRTAPAGLWCSWYAHRMAMTEELVLANAAVAAAHFAPLGMEIIQLDHGWQRGDVTGDWFPNERFPHGLQWLARELQRRYGLRLGVWISPTDVAAVSDVFRTHPEWMLRDDKGQPRINWRWYWVPNPDCYQLDASHPEANRFIRDTFARLSGEGVTYYKIDFLAPCGGDQFAQYDPCCTRGWGVLRRAMEAIREGAGQDAFIRYCQPPPLLAAGLADGAYGGNDLLDGGVPGVVPVNRENARALAASWWVNQRLYRREVCDLSVRMQADVEEVRLRLALMALAGCSISFSDELQYLPPSRIGLMQKVLPPGAPAMRPLDLFRRAIPSVWHLHCERPFGAWEVVGLFNHEDLPRPRRVDLAELGFAPDEEAAVFEFWESRFVGLCRGAVEVELPPNSSRVLFVRRLSGLPQVLGTDMHILGGYHELTELAWDEETRVLSGRCRRLAGISGRVFLYLPPGYAPRFDFPLGPASASLTRVGGCVWMKELEFREAETAWTIPFSSAPPAPRRAEPEL